MDYTSLLLQVVPMLPAVRDAKNQQQTLCVLVEATCWLKATKLHVTLGPGKRITHNSLDPSNEPKARRLVLDPAATSSVGKFGEGLQRKSDVANSLKIPCELAKIRATNTEAALEQQAMQLTMECAVGASESKPTRVPCVEPLRNLQKWRVLVLLVRLLSFQQRATTF